jgi:hypothetical protein
MNFLPSARWLVIIGAVAMIPAAGSGVSAQEGFPLCPGSSDAITTFHQNLENYVALRHGAQDRAQDLSLLIPEEAIASALRSARADARQGNIFTTAVTQAFDCGIAWLMLDEEQGTLADYAARREFLPLHNGMHPRINASYPGDVLRELPQFIGNWLPVVPWDIEYRVFERDLVLWDAHAQIVVDFLPDAFPEQAREWP